MVICCDLSGQCLGRTSSCQFDLRFLQQIKKVASYACGHLKCRYLDFLQGFDQEKYYQETFGLDRNVQNHCLLDGNDNDEHSVTSLE